MRNGDTVKRRAFNQARWPRSEFNSANAHRRILLRNRAGNGAVTAPDIQHGRPGGNAGGKKIRKNTHASAEYGAAMRALQQR